MSQYSPPIANYQYDISLINADLATLVRSYEEFETRITNDIVHLFIKQLESKRAIPQGNIITIDKTPYELAVEQVKLDRILTLSDSLWRS